MEVILHIETSTRVCSVGVSVNKDQVFITEENTGNYSHSSVLTTYIEKSLADSGHTINELSAVAVSMGPGSYTGLRIGVSSAKGICYALDIPLVAIDTLHAMAFHALHRLKGDPQLQSQLTGDIIYCPMIDARRMEVYFNLFDNELKPLSQTSARIIDSDTFNDIPSEKTILLFGDGAEKCRDVIKRDNLVIVSDILPSAHGMVKLASEKFSNKDFEDLPYFEPFYLKDFVAGAPKVKGLFR